MKFAMFALACTLSIPAFAQFTQTPSAPQPATSTTVYSCDNDTMKLTVVGSLSRGVFDLELSNATIGKDKNISGKSEQGACVASMGAGMVPVVQPLCTVDLPSGSHYRLVFLGFEGEINSVKLIGSSATAACHQL